MAKTILKIEGMSCDHCVKRIEKALNELEGVEKAKVNLKKGIAKIKHDENIQTIHDLTNAVKEVGYEAEAIN